MTSRRRSQRHIAQQLAAALDGVPAPYSPAVTELAQVTELLRPADAASLTPEAAARIMSAMLSEAAVAEAPQIDLNAVATHPHLSDDVSVSTAEVALPGGGGYVRMADVESIAPERAREVTNEVATSLTIATDA